MERPLAEPQVVFQVNQKPTVTVGAGCLGQRCCSQRLGCSLAPSFVDTAQAPFAHFLNIEQATVCSTFKGPWEFWQTF